LFWKIADVNLLTAGARDLSFDEVTGECGLEGRAGDRADPGYFSPTLPALPSFCLSMTYS
jgi:hypothetical protein